MLVLLQSHQRGEGKRDKQCLYYSVDQKRGYSSSFLNLLLCYTILKTSLTIIPNPHSLAMRCFGGLYNFDII